MRSLLFPHNPPALLGMLAALVNAALRVAIIPFFITPVFDRVLVGHDLSSWPRLLSVGAVLALFGALALFAQDALLGSAAAHVTASWRERLYTALLRRQPGRLPGTSGGLASRILTDLKDVETYYQFGLGTLVAETLTLVGIFAVLFVYNVTATLLLLGLGIPLVGVLVWLGKKLERTTTRAQTGTEAVGAHLQEGLRHHAVVRAFAALPFMTGRFGAANRATRRANVRRSVLASLQTPLSQVLVFAAIAVLVAFLANSAAQGRMTTGEVTAYLVLVLLLSTPAQLLPRGYALLAQASSARRRLHELLATPPPAQKPHLAESPSHGREGLELDHVSFAYLDTAVLKEVNLKLPPRGLVALTGESGGGKTTLLQILLGFLEADAGAIYLSGTSLSALSDTELRKRVGYVPQTTDLLRGSVRDNLLLGRRHDDAVLWSVLEAAGLDRAVRNLAGGLDYGLKEDGAGLSGGQKQRLAVARALLSAPDLLLLDEPSANLDEGSERILATCLRRQARERLVLVVAHRSALIEAADRVLRLEHGHLFDSHLLDNETVR